MRQARKKNTRRTKVNRGSGPSPWLMLLVGLISGSLLTTLYLGAQSRDKSDMGSGLKTLLTQSQRQSPKTVPRATVNNDGSPPKANFDFYTVLPEIERVIPDDLAESASKPIRPRENLDHYILQVGSYAKLSDADRLKAKLVLSGFDTTVQKVSIEDKGVYYRVRVGPYTDKRTLKNARQRLEKLGVRGLPLKVSRAGGPN